jgi:hypothetical protein
MAQTAAQIVRRGNPFLVPIAWSTRIWVGRAGIRRIVLNVEDEKVTARRIYERLGFQTACTYLDGEYARI